MKDVRHTFPLTCPQSESIYDRQSFDYMSFLLTLMIWRYIMKKLRKISIQIYPEPEQEKFNGLLSKNSGKSKASIIRAGISKFIAGLPLEEYHALKIMNLGSSGVKEIAEKHDEYLISFKK